MSPATSPAQVQHLEGTDFQKSRSFFPAVITEGGRIVWLAGQTTVTDLEGKDISGKFEEQTRTIFALLNRTPTRQNVLTRYSVPRRRSGTTTLAGAREAATARSAGRS